MTKERAEKRKERRKLIPVGTTLKVCVMKGELSSGKTKILLTHVSTEERS